MSMSEAVALATSLPEQAHGLELEIAALRRAGANQFDPAGIHYLEALASRAKAQPANVKYLLDAKLAQALATFRQRFEQAQRDAKAAIAELLPHHPHASADLQQLLQAGDCAGVMRAIRKHKPDDKRLSLADLGRYIAQHSAENMDISVADGLDENIGTNLERRPELKSVRYFRATWSSLSVDKQLAQALDQAPKNAGPVNSHMLVLCSLKVMRDISPAYLNRFMSYADTLLCLDQSQKERQTSARKSAAGESGKKMKARRSHPARAAAVSNRTPPPSS